MDNVELQAMCAALGFQDGDTYQKEPDCLETVKDLIRFLKREDDGCEERRELGCAQILQKDLIPIIKTYSDDRILLETTLRLIVNLTQPAKLCFQNHIPEDKTNRKFYLEIESHLQAYKEAFTDEALFGVLTRLLGDLLKLDWEHRKEEDRLLIERLLILIRNILHVPPNMSREQRTDDDASIHDQVLWALHTSGLEDLLLYLASSDDERQFSFHVLEIVSLMFREQTAEQLARAGQSRSLTEKEKDEKELAMVREEEKSKKQAAILKCNTRHSRFGGTFTLVNVKSISDRDLIYHRAIGKVKENSFDHNKVPKKRPKNRRIITEVDLTRRSTLCIRLFLREFCKQFLQNCYNPLMYAVKDTLMRAKTQDNDETYYLWAMRFFMEFNRLDDFRVDLVSETMSVSTFHYIQTNLQNFHEMIMSQKKEGIIWSRRMHLALKSYAELLHTLNMMDKSTDYAIVESAKVLKSNVFYMMEYRDVFVILLRKFDETRQSRTFLKDLIETTHLFLKMLESFCNTNKNLVVQRKKHKIGVKKSKKKEAAAETSGPTPDQLEEKWDEVSSELSAVLQGRGAASQDVTPFDATSETDFEQQRVEAVVRIQDALRQNHGADGLGLFRAAREVWPEHAEFGQADISPEDEFMALREIFFADLSRAQAMETESQDGALPVEEEVEEEEETAAAYEVSEEQFSFKEFAQRFAQPQVVRAYVALLAQYRHNSAHTTHCVLKMLHRISFDCLLPGMLYQAALFRVFQKVLTDPACRTKHFQELMTFAKHIVRKFFEVAQNNDKIFMELLFWKSAKESYEIVQGYGMTRADSKRGKQLWTEELEEELKDLFEQYRENTEDGMDVADHIVMQISDQNKSRRMIVRQLVHMGLLGSARELKPSGRGQGRKNAWQEEDVMELQQLFEQYRDSSDVIGNIIANMTTPRSKHVLMVKILQLGLVSDRKELYKRRGKGNSDASGRPRNSRGRVGDGSEDDDDGPANNREDNFINERDGELSDVDNEAESSSEDSAASGGESDGNDGETDTDPVYIQDIKKAVRAAIKQGYGNALPWLQRGLMRTAEDREDEDDEEPIPMVPLTDEHENAMEGKTFQILLKRLGVKPPANEQERFWRIPGYLRADELRSRAAVLVVEPEDQKKSAGKIKSSDKFAALKAMSQKKKDVEARRRERNVPVDSDDSDDDAPLIAKPSEKKNVKAKRRNIPVDSDDSDDNAPLVKPSESMVTEQTSPPDAPDAPDAPDEAEKQWKSHRNSSGGQGSGSDDERLKICEEEHNTSPVKRRPGTKRKAVFASHSDSDETNSETEGHVVLKAYKKKRTRIELESEESEDEVMDDQAAKSAPQDEGMSFPATMFTQPLDDSDSDLDDHVPLKMPGRKAAVIESDSD